MNMFWRRLRWRFDWWRLNIWYWVRYGRRARKETNFHELIVKTLQERKAEIAENIIRHNALLNSINAEKRGGEK